MKKTVLLLVKGGGFSLLLLLFFFFVPFAHAATLLTVCASGCSYSTIQAAVDAIPDRLSDAYVIEVRDSRMYEESITISKKTTSALRTITIKNGGNASPTMLAVSNRHSFSIAAPYVIIDGMQFSGNFRSRAHAINMTTNNTTVRNSRFHFFNEATLISMREVEGNVIENNIFEKSRYTTAVAISFYGGVNTIRRNAFLNITQGIFLSDSVRGNAIEDNTFLLDGNNDAAIVSKVDFARTKASRIDGNRYYLARGAKPGSIAGIEYATLAEWQAVTGFDAHAEIITAPVHPDFTPWSAVTKTVCASGCDYATIHAAYNAVPSAIHDVAHELVSSNTSYTIEVRDNGVYDGNLVINVLTDPAHILTIVAAAGFRPTIRQGDFQKGFDVASSYVTIRGFLFPGGHKTHQFGGAIFVGGSNVTIEDNVIENTPAAPAIFMQGGSGNRIVRNAVRNTDQGILIRSFSTDHSIEGNTIADTAQAIVMLDATTDVAVVQNTFFHNTQSIVLGKKSGDRTRLRNNIFVADGAKSTLFVIEDNNALATFDSDYHTIFTTNGAAIARIGATVSATLAEWQSQGKDANSLVGDPLFAQSGTAPYDFHLQSKGGRFNRGNFTIDGAHSPAIDAGDPETAVGDETAPHGGRVNIGAYGQTREASKSFTVVAPPPPSPNKDGAWVDTSDADWQDATLQSVTMDGTGEATTLQLASSDAVAIVTPLPFPATIGAVAFMGSNDGFAAGARGAFFRWNGEEWENADAPTKENIWGMSFANPQFGLAVGNKGTILRWNGTAWAVMPSGTTKDLLAVSVRSADDAWAVGEGGTILRWNGTAWAAMHSGTTDILNGVYAATSTDAWAVGNNGTVVHWDGSVWTTIAAPTTNGLFAVQERPDGSVIAIGESGFIGRYAQGNWTVLPSATTHHLLAMVFFPNGRGWIVGDHGAVLETSDGTNWHAAGNGTAEAFFATAVEGSYQWTAGTNGFVVRTGRSAVAEGNAVSRVFDVGVVPVWKSIMADAVIPTRTGVKIQFATSASGEGPWNFLGPDGTTVTFFGVNEIPLPSFHAGNRFARYRLTLTSGGGASPTIRAVTVRYSYDSAATPLSPTLQLPEHAAHISKGSFVWTAVPGGEKYEIEIGNNPSFTAIAAAVQGLKTTTPIPGTLADGSYAWHVRALTPIGKSAWSAHASFTLDTAAPDAPRLLSPFNGSTVTTTPPFSWAEIADAASYDLHVGKDLQFTSPMIDTTGLTNNAFLPASSLAPGSFFWRVRARDRADNVSGWSVGNFTVQYVEPPPTIAPPLLAPVHESHLATRTVTFSWERIPDTSSYTMEIATDALFTSPLAAIKGGTASASWEAPVDGPYFWRVRGENQGGAGPWSSVHTFTIDTVAPSAPVLITPESGIPLLAPATPEFSWDETPDTTRSMIEVAANAVFTGPSVRSASILAHPPFNFTASFDKGNYFWRVKNSDKAGNRSEWSAVGTFTVVASPEEGGLSPIIIAPKDNVLLSTPPVLSWNSFTNARFYDVEVAVSNDFRNKNIVTSATVQAPATTFAASKAQLFSREEGRYFWRIRAKTARGLTPFSTPVSFRLDRVAPEAPAPIEPVDRSVVTHTHPTLSWLMPKDTDAVSSTVTLLKESVPKPILLATKTLLIADGMSFAASLPGDGEYLWTVTARDASGNESVPASFRFTVIQPPDAPKLLEPAHEAVLTTRTVSFQWTDTGTDTYLIDVAPEISFAESILSITQRGWELRVPDIDDGTYYWRVRGIKNGVPGSFSGVQSFTVDTVTRHDVDVRRIIVTYYPPRATASEIAQRCGAASLCSDDLGVSVKKRAPSSPEKEVAPVVTALPPEELKKESGLRGLTFTRAQETSAVTTLILSRVGRVYAMKHVVAGDELTLLYDVKTVDNVLRKGHALALAYYDPALGDWSLVSDATHDRALHALTAKAKNGNYAIVIIVEKRGVINIPIPPLRQRSLPAKATKK